MVLCFTLLVNILVEVLITIILFPVLIKLYATTLQTGIGGRIKFIVTTAASSPVTTINLSYSRY
jgi:hypothetical protein